MNIDFPFHFDTHGRTATTGDDDHIRDMIEQFLFTKLIFFRSLSVMP